MLKTVVKRGSYHDSVVLMLLTNEIIALDKVSKAQIMMATPANKDIFIQAGLGTEELLSATTNDMVIVADIADESVLGTILSKVDEFFSRQTADETVAKRSSVKSWESALSKLPNANLAVISIPGAYASLEADRALDEGMNVFMFSDNVTIEEEKRLKEKAHEKGLLVMGPDCGTGIIQSVPIAFTNSVNPGRIGIIGASGTGIQELTCIIDRLGEGVTNAIGVGGRDLSEEIGGITMLDSIAAMENDDNIDVMIVISKPPAKSVREKIERKLESVSKNVVTLFLGEKPDRHYDGLYNAYTLDEAARIAVNLVRGKAPTDVSVSIGETFRFDKSENKSIHAYYSGGTLASEAAMLIKDALELKIPPEKHEGFMLNYNGNVVVDLGDDVYTQGTPHPMINPAKRIECMKKVLGDNSVGVVLFDVMLGFGSHDDMAGALIPTINEISGKAAEAGRKIFFVATVCGTRSDFQGFDSAVKRLKAAGVIVCETNKLACLTAINIIGRSLNEPEKPILPRKASASSKCSASPAILELFSSKPNVINLGIKSFAQVCEDFGCRTVQFDWAPPAGGDIKLIKALRFLREQKEVDIEDANDEVISKIVGAQPVLVDNVPAKTVIKELNSDIKTILHAGPPITYAEMPDTVKGSCIGAVLFEEWADNEADAKLLLSSGDVRFIPCHHVNAVGPMGGITTANMPVFVVKNETEGNLAYCTMNEGIGKVLRFGAYSKEVIDRLRWMRDVLGPTLSEALQRLGGIPLNPLIAKAIAMGDEFHQRNIAASLVLFKELAPVISSLEISEDDRFSVMKFLADTDQFFLNIMMATGKAIMDGARKGSDGTIVTAMCRNGVNFGIRIAGMGDEWFTGPVNTPQGLYFAGYDKDDGCPDIGDSAITETVGVGGMAMIAAPAVTRFVGAGGFEEAVSVSNEMADITLGHNPNYIIPNWSFKGACLGIDARLVVEKQITPVINTGIAHKVAGYGQIGAGTVHPPVICFEKAIYAYAKKLGFNE